MGDDRPFQKGPGEPVKPYASDRPAYRPREEPAPRMEIPEHWPQLGEMAVAECVKILQFGAFFKLLEHPNVEAFCHISEVSSGWVKNIYSVVSKGQIYVGKVVRLDPKTNEVNISLRRVTDSMKNARLLQWRFDKRAKALTKVIAERIGITEDECWDKIAEPLIDRHESLFKAFEEMRVTEKVDLDVPQKWKDVVMDVVVKSIEVPKRTVKGVLEVASMDSDGLSAVKEVLAAAHKAVKGGEVYTMGAPKYAITASSHDYKSAEKLLNSAVEVAQTAAKKHKGTTVSFKRVEE